MEYSRYFAKWKADCKAVLSALQLCNIYPTLTFTEHLLCAKHGSRHLKYINTFNHTTSLWRRYFYYLDIAHKGTETQSI